MKSSFQRRIIKLDFLHGVYQVPMGMAGMYVAIYHLEYILHAIGALIFFYAMIDGIHKLCYDPVKREALKVIRRDQYIQKNLMPVVATAEVKPSDQG